MTSIPTWKKHPSGLETLLVEKHDSPIVKLSLVFPFGSYEDPFHKEGLLNFVGDMLLRGTTEKSRDQIEFALDHLGASFHVLTGYHSMMVEGRVLSKNIRPFLKLMKEVLTKPAFVPNEVKKLKNEIKADLLLRLEDDQDLAKYHFNKEIYAKHPYSRDVIGTAKSMDEIDVSEFQSVYSKYFSQFGMLIGASGDLTPQQFEEMAHEIYDFFPKSTENPTKAPFTAKQKGLDIVLIDKPELTQTQFFIGQPCLSSTHEDLLALDVFSTAFAGSMFQAKYMQEIRVKRGWSYGAYGSVDSRRDGGSYYLFTFPKNEDTVDAIELSLDLFEQAVHGSLVDEKAFNFAKNYSTRSFPFKVDTPEKILAQKIYNKLSNRPDDALETYRDRLAKIDYKKAIDTARKHLTPKDVKVVMVCTANLFEDKLKERLNPQSITIKKYNEVD